MKYKYLSYTLSNDMPVFGGRANMEISSMHAISKGDSSNTYRFSMENHWGTHVDAPRHFFDNGKSVEDYPPSTWVFKAPQVIDVSLNPAEVLNVGRWTKKIKPITDVLILRSGWGRFRGEDKYIYENPGIDPSVGIYLRKKYRKLRAIAIDWISISSLKNRELGREAHRAFLGTRVAKKPLLIVEDIYLPTKISGLRNVIILPLVVSGIDSAPCAILGVFDD